MTKVEVLWIISEFQNLGLDHDPGTAPAAEYELQRKRLNRWYLASLEEGFGLTDQQVTQAEASLKALSQQAFHRFRTAVDNASGEFVHEGKRYQITSYGPILDLVDANRWLKDEAYAPWNLCSLTEDQRAITWLPMLESMRESDSPMLEDQAQSWLSLASACRSFDREPKDDFGDFSTGEAPGLLGKGGAVFPLLDEQGYPGAEPGISRLAWKEREATHVRKQVLGMHPAQLRMLLLLSPDGAARIEQIFRAPGG
ncbi:hypothetical protein [Haloferula sp. A504]|uniref:hypothetical protein n=1 Tax=Haloferula sp. A504 TaxID=3373601 RepID=UPI0031C136C9|nr:hypothetical protein [Verrucomicrobiaceae bacterium E54]